MRFDVVGGGGSEEARIPTAGCATLEKLPEPNATPALGPLARHARRAVADRRPRASTRTASTSRPRLGTTELWQWHNPSNRVHPMHLHGMLFRIVERSQRAVHPGERGWKDTVGVLPGETVTVQPWFAPVRRPLRVPLPRARARRQGDDAAAGGRVMRALVRRGGRGSSLFPAPAAPTSPSRRSTARTSGRPAPSGHGQGRREGQLVVRRARRRRTTSSPTRAQLGRFRRRPVGRPRRRRTLRRRPATTRSSARSTAR